MAVKLAEVIAGAVKEGLSLWKTFIATRQTAYNRKQDKRQEKAISIAEESYEKISGLFELLSTLSLSADEIKAIERHKIIIYKLKSKFNKYD